jgi:hypothetical protein
LNADRAPQLKASVGLLDCLIPEEFMKRVLPLILFAAITAYASYQRASVMSGFGTGQDYIEMSADDKRVYAMGALNGMLVAPLLGARREDIAWLEACVPRMTDEQVAAILTKYIRERPGQWHLPLNILTFEAMKANCPKPPVK